MTDRICVGVVTGSYGVRGEARLKSFCAEPSAIADYSPLWDEDGNSYTISLSRPLKGGFGARLGGVTSKEQADGLKGLKLFANRGDLPSLPEDEFYHTDLIGLDVLDTGGEKLGRVTDVHDHGGGTMLEITGPAIKGSSLLLFTLENVPTVDLSGKRIVIDPPDEATDD
ncbi:MAG: 16S rRNA processing protein RimM [Alphaproteobacteria bacterium]|nr:16S rRNA processing protein RimM [Alphaproteobacteria bacterium]